MTLGMRAMMNQVSILAANLFVSCILLVGSVMTGNVFPCRQSVYLLVGSAMTGNVFPCRQSLYLLVGSAMTGNVFTCR